MIAFLAAAPIIVWAGTPVCHCPTHEHADGEAAHRVPQFSPCGDESVAQSSFVWLSAPETPAVVLTAARLARRDTAPQPSSRDAVPETPPPKA